MGFALKMMIEVAVTIVVFETQLAESTVKSAAKANATVKSE